MKKATLTDRDVLHLAKLANLKLTEAEIKNFRSQLSSILDYVGQLNEVDTEKVNETTTVTGLTNILREDEVKSGQKIKSLADLAVEKKDDRKYFKVKRIM